ncbi:hypothetical protein VI817_004817 [Penicillium citrinum]|nr:hypothetical protein VI817_004817 [Penicillium citrinum]
MFVGLNHTDYKAPRLKATPGAILGCDFTGTVLAVHSEAPWASAKSGCSRLREGTYVSGLVHGSNPLIPEGGAFSEYVLADGRFLLELPSSWSKLEKGAFSGVAWTTVVMSMNCLKLTGRPSRPEPGQPLPVLVYGGATTTGTMACQLLSSSGYAPIVTAGINSHDLVTSYGAVKSVPYTDPASSEIIRREASGPIRHAIDCITTPESVKCCFASLGRAGGRYVALEYCDPSWRTRQAVQVSTPLTYEIFGRTVELEGIYRREADPAKSELIASWREDMQSLLDQGKIKPHPPKKVPGGWQGIIKGLDMLRKGEVHGQKLVVYIDE